MAIRSTDPSPDAANPSTAGQAVAENCLGRTCLKWAPDGTLTAVDLQIVMQKLRQVDQELAGQEEGSVADTGWQGPGT